MKHHLIIADDGHNWNLIRYNLHNVDIYVHIIYVIFGVLKI